MFKKGDVVVHKSNKDIKWVISRVEKYTGYNGFPLWTEGHEVIRIWVIRVNDKGKKVEAIFSVEELLDAAETRKK